MDGRRARILQTIVAGRIARDLSAGLFAVSAAASPRAVGDVHIRSKM